MNYRNYSVSWPGTSHSGAIFVQWWFIEFIRTFNSVCSLNFIANTNAGLILQKI